MMLLEVNDLKVYYGESCVCNDVTLLVNRGEGVCLLGRNGVGKTTLLKSIMRLLPNRNGTVFFDGHDITHREAHEVAKLGMGYVPQGRIIFPHLTVLENLRLGTTAQKERIKRIPEIVFQYFPRLRERLDQRGGTLSGGEQQMLAIGRALCSIPKLVLLDEPSEGLSAGVASELINIIKRLCEETELSILLVEQNLEMALELTTRGYVMEKGQIVAQGKVEELESDKIVYSHLAI
jgi:urea ABC transporter ATP-binding protein UrtE